MKVMYDHHIFGQQVYGGISRYYVELTKNINNFNINAQINAPIHINSYIQSVNTKHVRGIRIPFNQPSLRKFIKISNNIVTNLMPSSNIDILHQTYFSNKVLKIGQKRTLLTVFDMIHELYPENFSAKDKTRKYKETSIMLADHIIAISHSTKNDMVAYYGINPNRISVVHLGVAPASVGYTLDPAHRDKSILFVGTRDGYKNFSLLVRAYSKSKFLCDNYKIIAFGGGKFSDDEVNFFKKLKISNSQINQISGNDIVLNSLYDKSTIMVYPSKYEGFGLPPLEAMSRGCPVIASNSSSIPEVVRNAAVLFDPNNANELQKHLELMLGDDQIRRDFVKLGKSNCDYFSWSKTAMNTLYVYQKVLNT